jgi:uncharacterized protein (DUF58 family)
LKRFTYRMFRATASLSYRAERRLTRAGKLAFGTLGAAGIMGFDTNRTLGYQVFTFLLALFVLALGWRFRFRPRLRVRRVLPRFVTAGEPAAYRVVLANDGGRLERGLALLENTADPRPSFEEFLTAREPGEARRNWFDRKVGYPRWDWLVRRNQLALIAARPLPPLPPGDAGEVRVEFTPRRRGRLELTSVTIARPDPFGLVNALWTIPLPQSLLVLPKRYPMPAIGLPGTRKYQRGGVALAQSVGESEEFVSLRDYRPGDPLRRIHWKSLARVGKPVVKEYQDEFFVRYALVLDTFTDDAGSERFEEAVSVAASIACAIQTQDSLLDLLFIGPETYCFTAGRGLGNTDRMLEVLAGVRVCRDRPFRALHHAVLERHDALSACVAVLLAWDDPRRQFVRHLRALGTPVRALVVVEPGAPAGEEPGEVHRLEAGRVAEGLARL